MEFAGLIIPECAQMRGNCFSSKKLKALIISTIVISTVMTSVSAAPALSAPSAPSAPHNMRHRRQMISNACAGDHVKGVKKNQKSGELCQLQIQMKLIIADFKFINRTYINENYGPVKNYPKQLSDIELPRNQFKEYQKFAKDHTKMKKLEMISKQLPKLFTGLHTYGIAFRKLYDMKPHTESAMFAKKKRTDIMQHIIDQHRALVCEVETSFNSTGITNENKNSTLFNSDIDWPEHPDLTTIHTRDLSVFLEYNIFLKDWQKILRRVNGIKDKKLTTGLTKRTQKSSPVLTKSTRKSLKNKRQLRKTTPMT